MSVFSVVVHREVIHTHQVESWIGSWVSENIWSKHLSLSSNRTVPGWWCCNSVMSLVSCAKLTISHKLLSTWQEFFLLSAHLCIISFGSCWQLKKINAVLFKGGEGVRRVHRGCLHPFSLSHRCNSQFSCLRSTHWSLCCYNHPLTDSCPQC